jgi:hypothetical protein
MKEVVVVARIFFQFRPPLIRQLSKRTSIENWIESHQPLDSAVQVTDFGRANYFRCFLQSALT